MNNLLFIFIFLKKLRMLTNYGTCCEEVALSLQGGVADEPGLALSIFEGASRRDSRLNKLIKRKRYAKIREEEEHRIQK